MYKAIDVAKYVINYMNEVGSPVSNLKLQKILYYIQAAMLVEKSRKCFEDPIMAWEFGPVVVPVYQKYREYGRGNIPKQEVSKVFEFDATKMKITFKEPEELDAMCKKVINKVVDSYKGVDDPFVLVKKTHLEKPWSATPLNSEIKCEIIEEYYKNNIERLYS